jgi:hypothetical protein
MHQRYFDVHQTKNPLSKNENGFIQRIIGVTLLKKKYPENLRGIFH